MNTQEVYNGGDQESTLNKTGVKNKNKKKFAN